MSKAVEILKDKEWSMGNGQCPECYGLHKGWVEGDNIYLFKNVGHRENCGRANAIRELGGDVYFVGELDSETGEVKK